MNRPAKILLWVVLSLVGLALAAVIVVRIVFTKERILAILTPRIEQAISRPVSIGDAGISFWGGIGVWVGDVTVGNHPDFSREPFLAVHKIEFKARFWPLLAGRVELDRVILESPSVLLEYDTADESNLKGLFASRPDDQRAPPAPGETEHAPDDAALLAPVTVDHFILTDGEIVIIHAEPPRRIHVAGADLDLRTRLGDAAELTRFHAELAIDTLAVEGRERRMTFGEGRPRATMHGQFNLARRSVTFDSASIRWFGAELDVEGGVRVADALTSVQLKATLAPAQIADIIGQLVSSGVLEKPLEATGTIEGDAEVGMFWPLPAGTVPDWKARIDAQNLTLRPTQLSDPITVPRLALQGEGRSVSWSVPSGSIAGGTFSAFGSLDKVFSDAREFSGRLTADLPAASVNGYLPDDLGMSLDGHISADLNAFGSVRGWKDMRITGPVRSRDLVVVNPSWSVDTVTLAFEWELSGHDVRLRQTDWRAGRSYGAVTGTLAGIIPAALQGFETPDVPRAQLTVRAPYFDFDQFLEETTEAPGEPGESTSGTPLPTMSADGTISCDTVVYSAMTITAVKAPFTLRENVFTFDPITGRVYSGRAQGSCVWDVNDWENPLFAVRVSADSIEANPFLDRYLGWAGGLSGQISMRGEFAGRGRERAEILPTLAGNGSITMRSGRLEAAPLLQAIGTKTGLATLSQARALRDAFANFHIVNGRIVTDTLRMTSDEGRWLAMGSFGFDYTLDYLVTLRLSESAAQRVSALLAGSDLKLGLSGTVMNPRIELDVSDVGKTVVNQFLKSALADTSKVKQEAEGLLKGLLKKKP